jgi:hypothetical protein
MRRLTPILALMLTALVAGCAGPSESPNADPATPSSAAADPVAVIQQAMERSLSDTVTIDAEVKAGGTTITLNGQADPVAKALQVSGKAPEPIEARVIGDAAYIKMDATAGRKPWTKVDLTKLKPTSSLRQSFDLKSQTGIIGGIVTAEDQGDGTYRGTADLAKAAAAAGPDAGMRDSLESASKLAADPSAIPFEATVVDGRVTALSYTIATTSLGDLVTAVRMSGFGEPVTVTAPPAGQTEEATPEMYQFL